MSSYTLRTIFSLIIPFLVSGNTIKATDYYFKRISIEQGLSQPGVTSILRDYNGILWIGTRQGLNRVNRNDLKIYFHEDNDSNALPGNYIYNLHEDAQNNLWVTSDRGLSLYNRERDIFETIINNRIQAITNIENGVLFGSYSAIYFYSHETKNIERLPLKNNDPNNDTSFNDYFITHLYPMDDNLILVATEGEGVFTYNLRSNDLNPLIIDNIRPLQTILYDSASDLIYLSVFQNGLYCYSPEGELLNHYTTQNSSLSNNIILDIKKHTDKIWLATDGSGVDVFDTETSTFGNIRHIPGDINSLPVNSITVLYKDNNNLWAGTVRDGVFLFKETYIRTYRDIALGSNKGLSEKVVISLFEDNNNNLWIGTDGGGINMFDPETELFTHHLKTYGDKVVSITDYSDTELLVSLYGKGVFIYNIRTQQYTPFTLIDEAINKEECFSGFVPACYKISPDKILILSKNAYIYNIKERKFNIIQYADGLTNMHSLQLVYNDKDRCFMTKGNTIYILEIKENLIRQLRVLGENEYVNSICYEKSKNRLWIASSDGLKYYDINSENIEKVETSIFNRIAYMYLDTENRLWINASNMLFSYDIKSEKIMIWDESDGFLPNNVLTLYVKPSRSGNIYMGGSSGLVKINKNIYYNDNMPVVFGISDIELDGKVYSEDTFTGTDRRKVPQNYNSLNIRVNLNEEDFFRRVFFRYRINNQNNNSIVESYSNSLNLASLAPGNYNIFVSCMTKNGSWTEETSLFTFEVIPPWYKSSWFILLLIVFSVGIIIWLEMIMMKRNRRKLQWEMAMHRQELNEDKIQFLTNVSHELRTPLTLIYAPLKRILANKDENSLSPVLSEQIENIYRQASHMKGIINWILDYDRNSTLSAEMSMAMVDINELIRKIANDFSQEFREKQIDIRFELDEQLQPFEMDETKIRVVISNLLMNALKFSNADSYVIIKSNLKNDFVHIQVEDKGIGLKGMDTNKLFTRYYQGKHGRKGSGIGLAYCKDLVEKHGGNIGAIENTEAGTIVFFELPYKTDVPERVLNKLNDTELYDTLLEQGNFPEAADMSAYTILIVDDNKEFLHYLDVELKPLFKKVLKATNGTEALDVLKNTQPDIVISDLMMPVMNGYQLCREIKENIEISHIPVILLTAKSDNESRKIGYKLGADSYLSKPFDIDMLLSITGNQLKNKEIIRQKYRQEIRPLAPEQTTISNADEQFMTRLNQLIKDNYNDSDFDVSVIMDNLAMSRASLYSKMKSITGLGINDYINKFRIAAACSLLINTDKSIADIAFETGFTSQRYFSTVFKQATGETPRGYRSNGRREV